METEPLPEIPQLNLEPIALLFAAARMMGPQYWHFVLVCLVGGIISGVLPIILAGPMACGIATCYLVRLRGEDISFDMLFKGFDHFVESLIANIIVFAIALVLLLPALILVFILSLIVGHEFLVSAMFFFFGLYALVVTIGVVAATLFVSPLIVDRRMKGWEAVKMSALVFRSNVPSLLLLTVVIGLVTAVGSSCLVAMPFLLPICIGAVMLVYRELFPDMGGMLA